MKKIIKIGVLMITGIALTLTSCQKQPTASIQTSSTTVTEGQSVTFKSISTNAKTVKWTFPDGQTSTANEISYTFNNAGSKTVKLEAFSKNGKKSDEATIIITVNTANGDVTFWQSGTPPYNYTDVTINGVTKTITLDYPSGTPACNSTGCASFNLPVGTYNYSAAEQGGGTTWSGTVNVTSGGCLTVKLS